MGGPLDSPCTCPVGANKTPVGNIQAAGKLNNDPCVFEYERCEGRRRLEAEGRVRICHDASNRAHGASCCCRCLPHFLAFYSAGADGTDEADVEEPAVRSDSNLRVQSWALASTSRPLRASLSTTGGG